MLASTYNSDVHHTLLLFVDFPRTADLRVYHLGLRPGEVANRLVRNALIYFNVDRWCAHYLIFRSLSGHLLAQSPSLLI